jgi:hypothetical protein
VGRSDAGRTQGSANAGARSAGTTQTRSAGTSQTRSAGAAQKGDAQARGNAGGGGGSRPRSGRRQGPGRPRAAAL